VSVEGIEKNDTRQQSQRSPSWQGSSRADATAQNPSSSHELIGGRPFADPRMTTSRIDSNTLQSKTSQMPWKSIDKHSFSCSVKGAYVLHLAHSSITSSVLLVNGFSPRLGKAPMEDIATVWVPDVFLRLLSSVRIVNKRTTMTWSSSCSLISERTFRTGRPSVS